MSEQSAWQFDEFRPGPVDYTSAEQVRVYDAMHQKFRDYRKASDAIVAALGLGADSAVIDMGAGTGAFALHAAPNCRVVYAVDVSQPMLDYCRARAQEAGIGNIVFQRGGLLTYQHTAAPADAMICVAVLHHLPDFWKLAGLRRAAQMLKDGGRLFLFDIVFPSAAADLDRRIGKWIETVGQRADARLAAEAIVHIRDEFSTYDWIMEGMLEQAGFRIDSKRYDEGFQATYVCVKGDAGHAANAAETRST